MEVSKLTAVSQQLPATEKINGGSAVHDAGLGGKPLPLPVVEQKTLFAENTANQKPAKQPSPDELRDLVVKANESPLVRSSDLNFSIAEGTDISVVRIEDSKTGELIRQIPSEDMVALARALKEQRQGMVLEETV